MNDVERGAARVTSRVMHDSTNDPAPGAEFISRIRGL